MTKTGEDEKSISRFFVPAGRSTHTQTRNYNYYAEIFVIASERFFHYSHDLRQAFPLNFPKKRKRTGNCIRCLIFSSHRSLGFCDPLKPFKWKSFHPELTQSGNEYIFNNKRNTE